MYDFTVKFNDGTKDLKVNAEKVSRSILLDGFIEFTDRDEIVVAVNSRLVRYIKVNQNGSSIGE